MPIITLYFLANGVGLPAIVLSQVFYSIFNFIGEIPTGIFADRIGKKYAQVFGHLMNAISFGVMLLAPNVVGLFVGFGMLGFADSFLSGSGEAILYESGPKETFKRRLGHFLANETIGFAIGTAVAGVLLALFGQLSYKPILIMMIITKGLAFLIALTLKNPPKAQIQNSVEGSQSLQILKQSFGVIKNNQTVRTLVWVTVLTLSGEYFLYSVYQPHFESAKVAPIFIGLVLTLGAIVNFFVLRYAYLLEKKYPLEKIIVILNVGLAAGYVAMGLLINPVILVGSFIMLKGLFNAPVPIMNDYIHEHAGSHIRSTVMSGISQIKSLVQIGTRILLGVLVGLIGISHTLLLQGIYLVIGIGIAYWLMVKCGCTHRIATHHEDLELETAEIQ